MLIHKKYTKVSSTENFRIEEKIESISRKIDYHLGKIEKLKTPSQIKSHQANVEFLTEIRLMLCNYKKLKVDLLKIM